MSNKPIIGDQSITGTVRVGEDLKAGGDVEVEGGITAATLLSTVLSITEKTPVNAVAASGKMVSTGTLAADGTVVGVGDVDYTLKTTLTSDPAAVPYEVLLGANTGATALNLVAAITGGDGEGTAYGTGTEAHPLVTAEVTDTDDVTITAETAGTAGNAITTTDDSDQISWANADVALVGGVDGTVGVANEICADGTYLYHCIAANTISGANWRQISLGTAY